MGFLECFAKGKCSAGERWEVAAVKVVGDDGVLGSRSLLFDLMMGEMLASDLLVVRCTQVFLGQ
jgi:hypothetical protein